MYLNSISPNDPPLLTKTPQARPSNSPKTPDQTSASAALPSHHPALQSRSTSSTCLVSKPKPPVKPTRATKPGPARENMQASSLPDSSLASSFACLSRGGAGQRAAWGATASCRATSIEGLSQCGVECLVLGASAAELRVERLDKRGRLVRLRLLVL